MRMPTYSSARDRTHCKQDIDSEKIDDMVKARMMRKRGAPLLDGWRILSTPTTRRRMWLLVC